jgi:uncharacterized membrane protein YcaP (DUF421 family)
MDIVLRAIVAFSFVFLLVRIVGRRELNSLEPFDLIMLVVLGDLVQQGVTQQDNSVTGLMLAAGTIGILTVVVSWLSWRFRRLRVVLEGEPVIVVQNGEVIQRNIDTNRITREEVASAARQQQVASISDIRWAVLETDGQITVIPKQQS